MERIQTHLGSILVSCLPIAAIFGITYYFHAYSTYQNHFYTSGTTVILYNTLRIFYIALMAWMIYATGYLVSQSIRRKHRCLFSNTEWYILCFTFGLAAWHAAMLVLGLLNLYYQPIILALCVGILLMTANHFKSVCYQAFQLLSVNKVNVIHLISAVSLSCMFFWILLVRGLYPSGGHDYFTHYFHYFTSVIQNHGLRPNDVWYHYYYSKGAGLHFLGLLLTDPLTPALMTFICVMTAALALFTLVKRFTSHSLWPLFTVAIYFLYNLLLVNGGGEFQKIHEEVSALVLIAVWLLSLQSLLPEAQKTLTAALIATLISAVILTQPIAVFFIAYFLVRIAIALWQRNKSDLYTFSLITIIVGSLTFSILLLNYLVTGLISDQTIKQTWQFANVSKLKQWGVLANVFMVAWIRHNYELQTIPWKIADVYQQFLLYTRANLLVIAITSLILPLSYALLLAIKAAKKFNALSLLLSITLIILFVAHSQVHINTSLNKYTISTLLIIILYSEYRAKSAPTTFFAENRWQALKSILLITAVFAILTPIFGHSQVTSFLHFTTFFPPLIALICAIIWGELYTTQSNLRFTKFIIGFALPIALIINFAYSLPWPDKAQDVIIKNPINFLTGKYSLADAYHHQYPAFPFGAIHPGTWQATQHAPKNSRIWSTTVVSYCMTPNCHIESVISFKFSSDMNTILSGTPEQAKNVLQKEGLNYFLFLTEYPLLDYLPYSQLFQPNNIQKYFSIVWTDGKTYLLTWKNSNDQPVNNQFIKQYKKLLSAEEDPSFRFSESIKLLNQFTAELNQQQHSLKPIKFPWEKA